MTTFDTPSMPGTQSTADPATGPTQGMAGYELSSEEYRDTLLGLKSKSLFRKMAPRLIAFAVVGVLLLAREFVFSPNSFIGQAITWVVVVAFFLAMFSMLLPREIKARK